MKESVPPQNGKKLFERMRNDGETEQVSWSDLSFREKNDVLKSFALLFYILPATASGLSISVEKAYKHFDSILKESSLTGAPADLHGIEGMRISDKDGVKYEFKIPEHLQRKIEEVGKMEVGHKPSTVYRDWKVTIEYARPPAGDHKPDVQKQVLPRPSRPSKSSESNGKDPFEPR